MGSYDLKWIEKHIIQSEGVNTFEGGATTLYLLKFLKAHTKLRKIRLVTLQDFMSGNMT